MYNIFKSIELTKEELLGIYHKNPEIFSKLVSIKAYLTENGVGNNQIVIVPQEFSNDNYWLIEIRHNEYYLVPKINFKIDNSLYQNVQVLFQLENYQNQQTIYFNVKKPARVSKNFRGEWTLEEKGILEFSQTDSVLPQETEFQLESKFKLLEENLRLQLNEANTQKKLLENEKEAFKNANITLAKKLKKSEQKCEELVSELSQWEQEYQQHLLSILGISEEELEQFLYIAEKLGKGSKKFEDLSRAKLIASTPEQTKIPKANLNHPPEPSHESKKNTQTKSTPELNPISKKIVAQYNQNPNYFSEKSIEVNETKDSFENRRAGHNKPPILTQSQKNRGIAWIVSVDNINNELVPVANLKINEPNYKLIEALFDCQNYDPESSSRFTLIKPAIVSNSQGNWELKEKGELRFE